MSAPVNVFRDYKKSIYTLYVRLSKEYFLGSETEVQEHEFDTLLAGVCVAHLSEEITTPEFHELSSYLVRTYQLYILRKEDKENV